MTLNLDFVRKQFPAFTEPSLRDLAFFENAGGSFTCGAVIERLGEYYRRLKLQPYYPYPASTEAGEWMDASHTRLAEYLDVGTDEIHFGPSTSQNSYVLAQAMHRDVQVPRAQDAQERPVRPLLTPGDEIIVTEQDHEANSGVWRRLAAQGMVIKQWQVDPASGALDLAQLDDLLSERTRLVAFTHCSNVVAQINPVREITARVRAAGALSVVDGVGFAPHGLPDLSTLGADVYLFSLYKTYGPHQGVMILGNELLQRLGNEGHYFNHAYSRKRLAPAGPDHAQIAAARGIAEYFDALDAQHGGSGLIGRSQRVRTLLRNAEMKLLPQLLDYLAAHPDVRLLGPADASQRAATVSFVPLKIEPRDVVTGLARHGVMAASGNFYAPRLLTAIGVDAQRGVVRVSLVHYNSAQDVERLLLALDRVLAA